jgi:CDP-diacylglycerol--serine O-phosphatidyltransferase
MFTGGTCDLFDGFVSRQLARSPEQRQFGGNLDSVVDACSFGFAPVVLMYASGLNSPVEILLLILFAVCAVWRLAYFDTVGLQGDDRQRYFTGLPTTYVAMFLPLAFLAGFWGQTMLRGCVGVAMVALALSMISTIPVRKPGGVCYLLFPISGIALTVIYVAFADHFVQ